MLDDKRRTVVMSAFPPELTALAGRTEVERKASVDGVEITLGRLAGQDVALVLSGISMVNAAMTTQLVLDRLDTRAVVFSGIAGGVNPGLHIGDVVVPERWGQYLEAVFARQVGDGYRLPAYAKQVFPNFGMIFPQEVTVRSARHPEGESRFWFDVDPGMLAAARAIKGKVEGEVRRCAAPDQCLDQAPRFEVGGSGVSGMAFVDNKAFREYAYDTFHADVLDMESAAGRHGRDGERDPVPRLPQPLRPRRRRPGRERGGDVLPARRRQLGRRGRDLPRDLAARALGRLAGARRLA